MKKMSHEAKMFAYIAIRETLGKPLMASEVAENKSVRTLLKALLKRKVIWFDSNVKNDIAIKIAPDKANVADLMLKLLKDELVTGRFGKYTFSKRTKGYKALMTRIASIA